MNTYKEMNEKIAGLLEISKDPMQLYAALRIRELEAYEPIPLPPTTGEVTAVQELIEIVEMDYNNGVEISMKVFHKMLTKALVKEKQQMAGYSKRDMENAIKQTFDAVYYNMLHPNIFPAITEYECYDKFIPKKALSLPTTTSKAEGEDGWVEALKKIEQFSDCGSPELAIVRMKQLATNALNPPKK